jgi:hypothetical protein
MKKETKELVQWIINRLEHLKSEAIESGTLQTELPQEYEKSSAIRGGLFGGLGGILVVIVDCAS